MLPFLATLLSNNHNFFTVTVTIIIYYIHVCETNRERKLVFAVLRYTIFLHNHVSGLMSAGVTESLRNLYI